MFKSYLLLGRWVEDLVESVRAYLVDAGGDRGGAFVRAYPDGESRALILAECATLTIFAINAVFKSDAGLNELTVVDTQWSQGESAVYPGMKVNRVTFLVEGFSHHRETDFIVPLCTAADFRRHYVLQE